jgi:hypothetical protein
MELPGLVLEGPNDIFVAPDKDGQARFPSRSDRGNLSHSSQYDIIIRSTQQN